MFKQLSILVLTYCIFSCQTKTGGTYADDLQGCLTNSDIIILNKATSHFENKLTELYGNEDINQNYLMYLSEMGAIPFEPDFPSDFFLNPKSTRIMKELKQNGTYRKIWVKFVEEENENDEEIPITTYSGYEEPERETFDIDVLNKNGSYLKCMLSKNDNKTVTDILERQADLGDINTLMIAAVLKENMKKSDFENGLNKVVVAIGFYYDFVNIISKIKKK